MSRVWRLFRQRAVTALPVLLIVAAGSFLLLEAAPGDAADAYLMSIGGGDPAFVAAWRQQWGLDGSVASRLWLYLSSLARFDLGWSLSFGRPVRALIMERLPVTLWLMGSATLLSFLVGTALGIVAGARPGALADRLLAGGSLALYAMPGFWLALVLIAIFAVQLRWLPTAGIETVASGLTGLSRILDIIRHLALPVASLSLIYMALFLRMMRAGMVEAWRQDYALAARARGLGSRRIALRHIARNALLPLVTMLGLQAASILGGSVVIESVFAIPGFGRLAYEAVASRDAPLLAAIILVSAVMVVVVNLIVDLAYGALDPRVDDGGVRA